MCVKAHTGLSGEMATMKFVNTMPSAGPQREGRQLWMSRGDAV